MFIEAYVYIYSLLNMYEWYQQQQQQKLFVYV